MGVFSEALALPVSLSCFLVTMIGAALLHHALLPRWIHTSETMIQNNFSSFKLSLSGIVSQQHKV
jgi:hypothetical protein